MHLFASCPALAALAVVVGCMANSPPMYHARAKAYLESKRVAADLVAKLVDERPLSGVEADLLATHDDVATLHLLGANPGTPAALVALLAGHADEEVRWGAATHPALRRETMLSLRTVGTYSTMNDYLARNPSLPADVMRTMYWNREASAASIAMNPACPADIVADVLANQPDTVRAWLAWNRGLDARTVEQLDRDPSPLVARMLRSNPAYWRWKGAGRDPPSQR